MNIRFSAFQQLPRWLKWSRKSGPSPSPPTSSGPGPTAEHVQHLQPLAESALTTRVSEKSQEGGTTHGEFEGGEDPSEGQDHPAQDGRQHGGCVQWQDLQPGGNQPRDDLSKFSITYQDMKHRPGMGATHSSHFVPQK